MGLWTRRSLQAVLAGILLWAAPAPAATLSIRDSGFEAGIYAGQNSPGVDWVTWGSTFLLTATDDQFPGALPPPADGQRAMGGGSTFGGRIWQMVDGITVQPDMVYTLTVACGRALDVLTDTSEWDIYLAAGSDANATRLGTTWIDPQTVARGTFADKTLVVDTTGLDEALIGVPLIVALHDTGFYPNTGYHYYFDNVRLDASPVGGPAAHPGDANRDGLVNLEDFGLLKDHFGATAGATWEMGDFNADGVINLEDFGLLKDHFGHTAGDTPITAVPEPASLAAALAAAGLLIRRRKERVP